MVYSKDDCLDVLTVEQMVSPEVECSADSMEVLMVLLTAYYMVVLLVVTTVSPTASYLVVP